MRRKSAACPKVVAAGKTGAGFKGGRLAKHGQAVDLGDFGTERSAVRFVDRDELGGSLVEAFSVEGRKASLQRLGSAHACAVPRICF